MRRLVKGPEPVLPLTPSGGEPTTLSAWAAVGDDGKPRTEWSELQNPMKRALTERLLADQGGLCGYCGFRVAPGTKPSIDAPEPEGCHIDHILPRAHNEHLTFDFGNMLVSCNGYTSFPESERDQHGTHCGDRKGNWPKPDQLDEFVSPLAADCEAAFRFVDGEIGPALGLPPAREAAAARTIDNLALNHPRLTESRAVAIRELEDRVNGWPAADRAANARVWLTLTPCPANAHTLPPFIAALAYTLRQMGFTADEPPTSPPAPQGRGGARVPG